MYKLDIPNLDAKPSTIDGKLIPSVFVPNIMTVWRPQSPRSPAPPPGVTPDFGGGLTSLQRNMILCILPNLYLGFLVLVILDIHGCSNHQSVWA